jgi:hypothetical protein
MNLRKKPCLSKKNFAEKKTLGKKKLLTCVVGANNILIYYPEHDKNYDIHHKKNF